MMEIDLMTPDEMAAAIRLPRRQIYEAVSAGQLPCIRIGRRLRFSRAAIEQWIAAQTTQATGEQAGRMADNRAAEAQ